MAARSIAARDLKAEAAVLEKVVLQHRLATEAELAPYRPGAAENPDRDARGWLRWYVRLHRMHARGERGGSPAGTGADDATVVDALRNQPRAVRLTRTRLEHPDVPATLNVYPKSFHALLVAHGRDWTLGWLTEQHAVLQDRGTADDVALIQRVLAEISYQVQVLVWIACSEGVGLPFPDIEPRPVPPDWIAQLDPLDLYGLLEAHQVVNGRRLQAIQRLLTPDHSPAGDRPSWSVFFGAAAMELGVRPETLLRDWSLGEVLAELQLGAGAQRQAMDRAKAGAEA